MRQIFIRTVDSDVHQVANLLDLAPGQAERAQIPEDEMVVRARGLELIVLCDELRTENASVGDDLLGVLLEGGGGDLFKRRGDRSDRLRGC